MTDEEVRNLLFVMTDEQRYDTMAAYGNRRIETPNLNRLAREGIVFEKAYVTQPICTPSRASLLTGLYPHTIGCVANNIPLPLDTLAFTETSDFQSYNKCYIGKWHLGDEVFCQHGFDEWISIEDIYRRFYRPGRDRFAHSSYHRWLVDNGFDPPRITDDGFVFFPREVAARMPEEFCKSSFVAGRCSQFIRENSSEPFILFAAFLEPHMPFFGPRDNQYDPEEVLLPDNLGDLPKSDQPLRAQLEKGAAGERHRIYDINRLYETFMGTNSPSEKDWRRLIARYWGLVSQVDTAIGKILDTLRECDLERSTIVVFTSDHGDMMGSHQLITKGYQFEEAVRVPLIIKIPDHPKCGSIVRQSVSQVDLVPTLLDLMGKKLPGYLQGYSWKPMMEDDKELIQENVFIEWFPHSVLCGGKYDEVDHPVLTIVTSDGWKYNWSSRGQDELYDLNEDPCELENLVRCTEHSLVRRLRKSIKAWKLRTRYHACIEVGEHSFL